jgi:hypothetical protein
MDASTDGTHLGMLADGDNAANMGFTIGGVTGLAVVGIDLVNNHHINMTTDINIITPIIIIGSKLDSDSISYGSIFFHERRKCLLNRWLYV